MPGTLAWERAGRLASLTGGQTPGRNAGLKPGPDDAPATAHPAARSGQSAEDISPRPHRHGACAQPQNQAHPWVDRPRGRSSVGTSEREHPRPQEALLQQARALQQSEAFAGYRQRRLVVEHRLARLVQLGICQARYFGRAKTRFQLYLAATVANLTLVAGKDGLTGNIGATAIGDRAACADTGSAAAIFGAIRLGQIWPLALLTRAFLSKALLST